MRRNLSICFLAVMLFSCDNSIDEFQSHNFIKIFGSGYESMGKDVIELSDGAYVLTGYDEPGGIDDQIYAAKVDKNGNLIWENTYGVAGIQEEGRVVKAVSGGYLIAGIAALNTETADSIHSFILKIEANGDSLWYKEFGDPSIKIELNDIYVSNAFIYVAGRCFQHDTLDNSSTDITKKAILANADYYAAKLSLEGELDWEKISYYNSSSSFEKVFVQGDKLLFVGYAGYENKIILHKKYESNGIPAGDIYLETLNEVVIDAALADDQLYILANGDSYTKLLKLSAGLVLDQDWPAESISSITGKAFAQQEDGAQVVFGETVESENSLINTISVDAAGTAEYGQASFRTIRGLVGKAKQTSDQGLILIGSTDETFGTNVQIIKTDKDLFLLRP